jgi:hypothetical protein
VAAEGSWTGVAGLPDVPPDAGAKRGGKVGLVGLAWLGSSHETSFCWCLSEGRPVGPELRDLLSKLAAYNHDVAVSRHRLANAGTSA